MKILIIKLGALGDIIAATSIIKQIEQHHANDQIFLLTTPTYQTLFSGFDLINVAVFARKGLLNTLSVIRWIRNENFDRVYDLQSNDRSTIYCALSGIPFRAGNHPRFPYTHHPDNKFAGECHAFDRLNQIIISAGLTPAEPIPFLPAPEQKRNTVSLWLKKHKLAENNFVIFHAGSSPKHLQKRWPYFADLAKALSDSVDIVWVGGDDDIDLNITLSEKTGINATNQFDITELAELGRNARFAVTNDSAPMHILSCSQIPVFGLFGPTNANRSHALGQLQNVITAYNVIAKNDKEFKPESISKISPGSVLDRINKQQLL